MRSEAGNLAARHGPLSGSTPERTQAGTDHRPTVRSNLDAMDFADRNGSLSYNPRPVRWESAT
jgi:hypothetical protein